MIRSMEPEDAPSLAERRNEPEVARYQNWTTPFPYERAEALVSSVVEMEGPQPDEWWMASVTDASSAEVLGDLALHLSSDGRSAEVGYTFCSRHWGNGYAVEALDALIGYLFEELDVTRVFGMLHPDNPASAMVMERCGFLYEGHTRSSFWLDGEVSDDWIYGLTRQDWEAWRSRPTGAPDMVELVEIDAANVDEVSALSTHKTQEEFVAPMLKSFKDALFPEIVDGAPLFPWMRAIQADGEYVGFVMLALSGEHHEDTYLWRFLIDRRHQRRGIGDLALDLVETFCRERGDVALLTSWVEGKGSPRRFYERRGYRPNGKVVYGETEARKAL